MLRRILFGAVTAAMLAVGFGTGHAVPAHAAGGDCGNYTWIGNAVPSNNGTWYAQSYIQAIGTPDPVDGCWYGFYFVTQSVYYTPTPGVGPAIDDSSSDTYISWVVYQYNAVTHIAPLEPRPYSACGAGGGACGTSGANAIITSSGENIYFPSGTIPGASMTGHVMTLTQGTTSLAAYAADPITGGSPGPQ